MHRGRVTSQTPIGKTLIAGPAKAVAPRVEAACAVFAEKGYASTRVAEIAERAGVGKGTVYEYFSSKEELLFAVFEITNAEISLRMDDALAAG